MKRKKNHMLFIAGAAMICSLNTIGAVKAEMNVDYFTLQDFVRYFPEHVEDNYAATGREAIYSEEEMITWLDTYGWTDYKNLYADSGYPNEESPVWAFEAKNGEWNLSGYVYTEWHEKLDDDYSGGCNATISLECDAGDGELIYENCKDVLSFYFRDSYRDIEDGEVIWSGFFSKDSAARVYRYNYGYDIETSERDYSKNKISILLYDSIQPNLFGLFWDGVPLQKDGELLDVNLTVNTYTGVPECLRQPEESVADYPETDSDEADASDGTSFYIEEDEQQEEANDESVADMGEESDILEGVACAVVKCEDDERYTFLYAEQNTNSEKKLKLRKHNEVIISAVITTPDDITWERATYCGCTGWVQSQFLDFSESYRGDWQPGNYFVSVEKMNLREKPSESAKSIGKLHYGEEVVIQDFQEGWGEIHSDGIDGFVYMPCLRSYQAGRHIVNTDADYGIHFRNAPDKQNSDILCDIPNGSELWIDEFSNGWGHTQYNGMEGWVHLSDLYFQEDENGMSLEEYQMNQSDNALDSEDESAAEEVPDAYISDMLDGNVVELGSDFSLDLDGDGIEEEVSIAVLEESYTLDIPTGHQYWIEINGEEVQSGTGETVFGTLYGISLDGNQIELILYDNGPSDDPCSTFYHYENGKLVCLGTAESFLDNLYATDGILYGQVSCRVIQTQNRTASWKLNEAGELEEIPRDMYELIDVLSDCYGLCEPLLVADQIGGEEIYLMTEGEVRIPYTDGESWIYVEYADQAPDDAEVSGGWYHVDGTASQRDVFSGWFFAD